MSTATLDAAIADFDAAESAKAKSRRRTPKRKFRRLTDRQIIRRIERDTLLIDVFEGIAYRKFRGEWIELTCYFDRRSRKSVCIYHKNRRRKIMLNRLVWIAAHRRPIPRGHDVHHKDRDRHNYCWANLECLESEAHKRRHEGF
jgi:hypothetical protein